MSRSLALGRADAAAGIPQRTESEFFAWAAAQGLLGLVDRNDLENYRAAYRIEARARAAV